MLELLDTAICCCHCEGPPHGRQGPVAGRSDFSCPCVQIASRACAGLPRSMPVLPGRSQEPCKLQKRGTGLRSMQPGSLYFCLSRCVCGPAQGKYSFSMCVRVRTRVLPHCGNVRGALLQASESLYKVWDRPTVVFCWALWPLQWMEGAGRIRRSPALIPFVLCCSSVLALAKYTLHLSCDSVVRAPAAVLRANLQVLYFAIYLTWVIWPRRIYLSQLILGDVNMVFCTCVVLSYGRCGARLSDLWPIQAKGWKSVACL